MGHVVLLGDSVFDNASYVPGEPCVIDQLRKSLPQGWQATLLAVDGEVAADVGEQLDGLPEDTTHLVVSAGGDDALGQSGLLLERASSVADVLARLGAVQTLFRKGYRNMLKRVVERGKTTLVCTIYDAVPGLDLNAVTALSLFNDVIVREAFASGADVVDLRRVCTEPADYSSLSPIEPSSAGGQKIVEAIVRAVTSDARSNR